MSNKTMRAVVFNGLYKVAVEERPIPQIQQPEDIIVKATYTALCGRLVELLLPYVLTNGELLVTSMYTAVLSPPGRGSLWATS
jgi:hypothetical protein